MVEHSAVNRRVVGSSPTRGASYLKLPYEAVFSLLQNPINVTIKYILHSDNSLYIKGGMVLQESPVNKYYCFNTVVERSNPLILRRFYMPQDSLIADLVAASCIYMGIEPMTAELYVNEEKLNKKDQDKMIRELIHKGDEIRILLINDAQRRNPGANGLKFFAKVEEKQGSAAVNDTSALSGKPYGEMVVGMNIPSGIMNVAELNEIQNALSTSEYYDKGGGRYYSGKELQYSIRKTENAIRKYFAPETAEKEINMKLGMPMALLLEKLKVTDLKYIADSYGMYYDSSYRKPDLVHGISDRLGGGNVAKIFENMGISEFLAFKRLVLSETPGEEKWEYLLTELCNRGLILTIPKTGLRVASEVLEYYEGWYGTETETRYIYGKYCSNAFTLAARYYGIFSRKQFLYMLDTFSPGEVPGDFSDEWFNNSTGYSGQGTSLRHGLVYMPEFIDLRDVQALNKEMYPDRELFYRPSQKELLSFSENFYYISKAGLKDLAALMEIYSYHGYYDYGDSVEKNCFNVILELHKAGDVEAAVKTAGNEMRRLSWIGNKEEVLDKVRKILNKEADKIPIIALNGFSLSNCPKEILDHMKVTREKKITVISQAAKNRAGNVKKTAVAVKKRK